MNNFSHFLKPEEKNNFTTYVDANLICQMRTEIENMILSNNQEDSFDLVIFDSKMKIKNMEKTLQLCNKLRDELHSLGWKTILGFGDTALFVYCGKKPSSVWG
jgi:hypothetical protein